jgi:hypothetical protein
LVAIQAGFHQHHAVIVGHFGKPISLRFYLPPPSSTIEFEIVILVSEVASRSRSSYTVSVEDQLSEWSTSIQKPSNVGRGHCPD